MASLVQLSIAKNNRRPTSLETEHQERGRENYAKKYYHICANRLSASCLDVNVPIRHCSITVYGGPVSRQQGRYFAQSWPFGCSIVRLSRLLVSDSHVSAIHQGVMALDVRIANSLLRGMQMNSHTDNFDIDLG